MKPTKKRIKAELKKLRRICENGNDIESRVAWIAEQSIRWATEETVGWTGPAKDCISQARTIQIEARQ